jgi:hypothetical protein
MSSCSFLLQDNIFAARKFRDRVLHERAIGRSAAVRGKAREPGEPAAEMIHHDEAAGDQQQCAA